MESGINLSAGFVMSSLSFNDDRKTLFTPPPCRVIGWLEDGWIYTPEGKPWMFAEDAAEV
jgi:hypothetical protein